jgi:hypothetical protein
LVFGLFDGRFRHVLIALGKFIVVETEGLLFQVQIVLEIIAFIFRLFLDIISPYIGGLHHVVV